LAQALRKKFPKIEVAGNENGKFRVGSFEVTLDGELLHSKLETHRFPTPADVEKLIRQHL